MLSIILQHSYPDDISVSNLYIIFASLHTTHEYIDLSMFCLCAILIIHGNYIHLQN